MNKIKLLFDANIIRKGNLVPEYKRGYYWVAYNILKYFLRDSRFDVTLYLKNNLRKDVIECDPEYKNTPCVFEYFQLGESLGAKTIINTKFNPEEYDVYFDVDGDTRLDTSSKNPEKFFIIHDTLYLAHSEWFDEQTIGDFYQMYATLPLDTHYFCVSEYSKNEFLKYFKNMKSENIDVCYIAGGQDYKSDKDKQKLAQILDKYNIPKEKRGKYLFNFCGIGDKRKNLMFTIKNFVNFIEKYNIKDLYFYLGGSGKEVFWEEFSKNFNDKYKKYIVTLGYIDDEDVNIFLSNSLFFVCLSLYEGFGMPTLEAMMSSVATISSNNTSIPEVAGDSGILINPKDDNECIEAYRKMYFDDEFRINSAQKGYERSKIFSWDKTYSQISNKIIEILNSKQNVKI